MSVSQPNPMSSSQLLSGLELSTRQMEEELSHLRQSQETLTQLLHHMLEQMDQMRAVVAGELRRSAQAWDFLLEIADRCFAISDAAVEPILQHLSAGFHRLGYRVYGLCGEKITDWNDYEVVGTISSKERLGEGTNKSPTPSPLEEGFMPSSWVVGQTLKIGLRRQEGMIIRRAKVVLAPE